MLKYDVTGVGLNLGSGEEFVRKTGMPLPAGSRGGAGRRLGARPHQGAEPRL